MTYTAQGWLAEVATPGGRTVRTTYDAQGRPVSVTDPRGGVSVYP
jgi:YD repeat-containing protein